jgi:hypothetical protein
MNRKSFLILLGVLLVLGGAGLAVFWQDLNAWRGGNAKTGAKPLENLKVNDVAQIHIVDGKGEVTLAAKDGRWAVKQRADYSANYQDLKELLLKLPDLKVVQTENVGLTLLPRLDLVRPGADSKNADKSGTVFELTGKSGTPLASLLLGKKVIKIEDSPLPIKPQTPVGRYVLIPGIEPVLVVSDALNSAEANPARWLAKEFFKVARIKSLASSGQGAPWKISRSEEYGQWKFADGTGQLDAGAAANAVKALESPAFIDVAPGVKRESFEHPHSLVAETFDDLTYTIKIAHKSGGEDYYLSFEVSGEPPRKRTPEKGEKPEDKSRADKRFTEDLKKLEERLTLEKNLTTWTYVVEGKTLASVLKDRAQLVAPPLRPRTAGR